MDEKYGTKGRVMAHGEDKTANTNKKNKRWKYLHLRVVLKRVSRHNRHDFDLMS